MLDNLKILESLGLTTAEAKIYLALIYFKESKTGPICEKSRIPSSNVYSILDSLMKKGFVSYRLQNNVKIFMPSDPFILDDLFDQKQKDIEQERKDIKELINDLKNQQNMPLPISRYKYYEGIQAIKAVWLELTEDLKNLKKGETIKIYGAKKGSYESLVPIYNEFHKQRVKLKQNYQLILSLNDREHGKSRKELPLTEVRHTELNTDAEITIIGNNVLLQYITTKTPRAFLIQDEIFVKTFEEIFNNLWKIAKK